jgi:putative cardiolipin synthase
MRAPALLKGAAALVIVAAAAVGCRSLPLPPPGARITTVAPSDTAATKLGQAIGPLAAAHPGHSGVLALSDGRDAFAARVLLARSAERSLDVQYYLWHNDLTGVLMFDALREAAARGVRVRLLLDDNNTDGLDPVLALLDADPNIEVRLFNPFRMRAWRGLGYMLDFGRLNRRMHNKSFTIDNQATIVGGRNIGNEYFGAAGDMLFVDLDVLAVGPIVRDVSQDFDRYWNNASAYPFSMLVESGTIAPQAALALADRAKLLRGRNEAQRYLEAIRVSPFVEQLMQRSLPLEWSLVRLVSDDPAKVMGTADPDDRVVVQLQRLWGQPERQLDLVSPYFVPGTEGARALAAIARRGVTVRVLTNSLEATDVAAVHAGYAKRRHELLRAVVQLFELRRSGDADRPDVRRGPLGSSTSSLHAKTFSVDGRSVFVGSFNMDRRSIDLNTEMGFVIDNPAMAQRLHGALEQRMPERAYEVRLDGEGELVWIERSEGKVVQHTREPGVSIWRQMAVRILSLLPIDWLL